MRFLPLVPVVPLRPLVPLSPLVPLVLLSMHSTAPSWRTPRVAMVDDGWKFTSLRAGQILRGEPYALLVEPFAPPLWVGETRILPTLDGERFELLRSTAEGPFAHVAGSQSLGGPVNSRRYTGALATQAVCTKLGADGAELVGLRRFLIESVASTRPRLTARCLVLTDADSQAAEARSRAIDLWAEASELSRSIRQRKLEQKLSSLGGAASQLMLSISAADQAETLRRGGRSAERGRVTRIRSPREYLDAGGTFAEEAARICELLNGINNADEGLIPPAAWFESFIALRWASGGSEGAHAFSCGVRREVSGDVRSLGTSAASSQELVVGVSNEAGRWAEAVRLTEQGLAALRVEASLLSLNGGGVSDGQHGEERLG